MRNFVIFLVLVAAALAYIHTQQPKLWNQLIDLIAQGNSQGAKNSGSVDDMNSATADDNSSPRPVKTEPTIISPDSTAYINPDHVKMVHQPAQAPSEAVTSTAPPPPAPAPVTTSPAVAPTPPDPSASLSNLSRSTIPTTIYTLSGLKYTNCVLSRATPDGISFTHSKGVAKIMFSDLDPKFAATFGYDAATAKQYEAAQQEAARQSDQHRDNVISGASLVTAPGPVSPVASSASASSTVSSIADSSAPEPSGATPQMPHEQRVAIEDQVAQLTADLDRMTRETNGEKPISNKYQIFSSPHPTVYTSETSEAAQTKGAYGDVIKADNDKLGELKRELAIDQTLAPANRVLRAERRQALKDQILSLMQDIRQLGSAGQTKANVYEITKDQLALDDLNTELNNGRYYPLKPAKMSPQEVASLQARADYLRDYEEKLTQQILVSGKQVEQDDHQQEMTMTTINKTEVLKELSEIIDILKANGSAVAAANGRILTEEEKQSIKDRLAQFNADVAQLQTQRTSVSTVTGSSYATLSTTHKEDPYAAQIARDMAEIQKMNQALMASDQLEKDKAAQEAAHQAASTNAVSSQAPSPQVASP